MPAGAEGDPAEAAGEADRVLSQGGTAAGVQDWGEVVSVRVGEGTRPETHRLQWSLLVGWGAVNTILKT